MPPTRPQSTKLKPPSKKVVVIVATLVVLYFLASSSRSIATFVTDIFFYDSVGQGKTFRSLISAQLVLPVTVFVLSLTLIYAMLFIGLRYGQKNKANEIDSWVEPVSSFYRRKATLINAIFSLVVAFLLAGAATGQENKWILFRHAQEFGEKDPLFKKDIGFYIFELPFYRLITGWMFTGIVVLTVVSAINHYLCGSIRLEKGRKYISTTARIHLSILCALAGLAKATQYFYERYSVVHSTRGAVDGAAYTDVNAQLPAMRFLIFVAIIAAVMFIINVYRKGVVLPIVAISLWVIVALVVGTIYPLIVQNFVVKPSRNTKERLYAERNIKSTRTAYGLDDIENTDVNFKQGISEEVAPKVKEVLQNALLWDELSLAPWLQQKRGEQVYEFTAADLDRYEVDGKLIPTFVSARSLVEPNSLPDRAWPSRHVTYSHGFGAAATDAVNVLSGNEPNYLVSDLPGKGSEASIEQFSLSTSDARIYFGENLEDFVFVGSNKVEQTPTDDELDVSSLSGVTMNNVFKKAAFALRYSDYNIMIADAVTPSSKIIFERNPAQRVKKLAPFLSVDSNPYPVINNGEIIWIVDAYTTSDQYPYSQYLDTGNLEEINSLKTRLNYVRNSVKATVNARTGKVNLYIVDNEDPIIKAYKQEFPGLLKDVKDAPEEIVNHFRYPEDLFDVQTEVYSDYHVTDPGTLLKGSDRWQAAPGVLDDLQSTQTNTGLSTTSTTLSGGRADRTQSSGVPLPSLYQYVEHTGMDQPEFLLTRAFVPIRSSFQMDSFITVSSDGDNYGKMRLINFNSDKDRSALSPTQMIGQINSSKEFAQENTLLDQRGSQVIRGNLQIIPIEDTVVYVRPIYVKGESNDSLPVLTYVTVSMSGNTVCAPTIDQAVDALVAGNSICVPFTQGISSEEVEEEIPDDVTQPDAGSDDENDLTKLTTDQLIERLAQASERYENAKNPLNLGELQSAADEMVAIVRELNRR